MLPQCMTSNSTWAVCSVPNNAVITYVTSRRNGDAQKMVVVLRVVLWCGFMEKVKNKFFSVFVYFLKMYVI